MTRDGRQRDHVLEVGCGAATTALLRGCSAKQVIATDISSRVVEIASEKSENQSTTQKS